MREALLVMVHGSPRPASNADMFAVVDLVRASGAYPIVEVGFMELNDPTIPAAIAACVAAGAERIVGVPYFLHAGDHVIHDLPALLEAAQTRYPEVELLMGEILGHDEHIVQVVRDRAAEVSPGERG